MAPGDKSATDYARIAVPIAAVVLSLGRALGFFAGSYFMNKVARSVVHTVRTELFGALVRAPKVHLDQFSTGELLSKVTFNVEQVSGAASDALKTLLREGLTIVALVSYMLYLNWELTAVFFVVAPAIGLVVHVVGKHFGGIADVFRILWGRLPRSQLKALQDLMMSESTGHGASKRAL